MRESARPILARMGLGQTETAKLVGVSDRAVRTWVADPRCVGFHPMPESIRRLLLLADTVPGAMEALREIARQAENNG